MHVYCIMLYRKLNLWYNNHIIMINDDNNNKLLPLMYLMTTVLALIGSVPKDSSWPFLSA